MIELINPYTKKPLSITPGGLFDEENEFPLINGVYRMVDQENYSSNFGYQWNIFEKTQLDRINQEQSQSEERFFVETNWPRDGLSEQDILEVGSGAGRFSQIIIDQTKANLTTLDYSNAVEANSRNNGPHPRLRLFQASIYEMPFRPQQFDKVLCLGVLQHTPDFNESVKSLCEMVKPGGELVIDFYEKRSWITYVHAKYLLRPITRRMNHQRLLKLIEKNANWLISAYKLLYQLRLGILTRFLPICDIYNTLPKSLKGNRLREWVILDTFDMFSPRYDQPQTIANVKRMVEKTGLKLTFAGQVKFSNNKAAVVRAVREVDS